MTQSIMLRDCGADVAFRAFSAEVAAGPAQKMLQLKTWSNLRSDRTANCSRIGQTVFVPDLRCSGNRPARARKARTALCGIRFRPVQRRVGAPLRAAPLSLMPAQRQIRCWPAPPTSKLCLCQPR
jgi:hypothetical protein